MAASAAVDVRVRADAPAALRPGFADPPIEAFHRPGHAGACSVRDAPFESLRMAPHQVAGHSSKGMGLPSLVDDAGHFLKPFSEGRKGAQEVDFYRRVASAVASGADPASSLAGFAPFLPAYRGEVRVAAAGVVQIAGDDPTAEYAREIAAQGESATFIRLEDVTAAYAKPCVVDLKVGLRTYSSTGHDQNYIAKRAAHDKRSGQAEVGFKVCGMQTWEKEVSSDRDPADKTENAAWALRRRPYLWARALRSRAAVRAALEAFVTRAEVSSSRSKTKTEHDPMDFLDASRASSSPPRVPPSPSDSGGSGSTAFGCGGFESQGGAEREAGPGVERRADRAGCSSEMRSSSSSRTLASEVFGEALAQLRGLRRWFATQRELHLLGSSVLITYEGDARFPTRPRVCVIDFCNYVEAHGETDENFARGLDRLAEMMEEIVAERREAGGGEGNGV